MAELNEKLFSEFPPVSTQEWMDKIVSDLKGAPFEKKLVWKTNEGFDVNPFYRAQDLSTLKVPMAAPGEFPYLRGVKRDNNWKIRQNIDVKDFAKANGKALELLEKGVDALGFHFAGKDMNAANLSTLLKGIRPDKTELHFKTCNAKAAELADLLAGYLAQSGADLQQCFGSIAYDPFKKPMAKGVPFKDWLQQASDVLKAGQTLPGYRLLAVNGCRITDAGGYITQELGYALSWGNELLAELTQAGFSADEVAGRIQFNFGVGSNYFMEIAKFRAARWLWSGIVSAYRVQDVESCKMKAHAQTSRWNATVYDAHVNLLRTQTETMSAAIAGVDAITVSPFDEAYCAQDNVSDDFSKRIARNQQLLLKEECHFDKVTDPSAGSYYIETLTDSVANVAWKIFLEVEEKGGFGAVVHSGEVQQAVNASAAARKKAIATRKEILLGTNQFPNFTEEAAGKIHDERVHDCGCNEKASIPALDFSRGGSQFEALRLATEQSGKAPKVFMLTIGNLAMRLARSQFSSNFFACVGYKVIDNLGFDTVEAGVESALKAGAGVVVLCSSDDEYALYAPAAHKALAGKVHLVIAGAPACMEDLKAQGITHFIHVKSNVLETLQEFNNKLGIA